MGFLNLVNFLIVMELLFGWMFICLWGFKLNKVYEDLFYEPTKYLKIIYKKYKKRNFLGIVLFSFLFIIIIAIPLLTYSCLFYCVCIFKFLIPKIIKLILVLTTKEQYR